MSGIREELIAAREATPELFHDEEPHDWRRLADPAVAGDVLFYGTEPVHVGRRGIDWSAGHVQHQEWPAQLNRQGWINALRWAYVRTGDEEYARAARDYIEDWLDYREPYRPEDGFNPVPGESSLNMAVRLGGTRHVGWLATMIDLMASDAFDEAFAERIVESIRWQLDWVLENMPPKNNWRVAALDATFSQGLRLPGRLDGHLSQAAEGLSIELKAQVLADGAHAERSGGYHDWMTTVFITLWRISRRRPDLRLEMDTDLILGMSAYRLHHTKPNAAACGFNDAQAHFGTTDASADQLTEMLADHKALLAEAGRPTDAPTSATFDVAGHCFHRTGWGADDLWWGFDAAGSGGGHDHLSRLSLELHHGGKTILPDPGIFDYEMSNPFAPAGKATAAHSTMNVELGNQADVDARLVRVVETDAAVVAQGAYEGSYWPGAFRWAFTEGLGRGRYGVHDRTVVWLKDRAFVVLDWLAHDAGAAAYLHWVSDDAPYELDAEAMRFTTTDAGANVRIQVAAVSGGAAAMSVHRGEKDPYLGWVCERHGEIRPAPLVQVRFDQSATKHGTAITECASVIALFEGAEAPDLTIVTATAYPFTRQVDVRWSGGRRDRIVYTARLAHPIRDFQDTHSDARLLVLDADGEATCRID